LIDSLKLLAGFEGEQIANEGDSPAMNAELIKETRESHLVIFAGAGVSMSAPSSLPGWKALNETILHALRK